MINALFVVWREFFECMLIIGILYSYLSRQENAKVALRYMWGGAAAGAVLSAFLALGMQFAETELEGAALEYFQAAMLIVAAVLMAQMCVWMKIHARKIKSELQNELKSVLSKARLFGIASITALALAREGFEVVMFLYGMSIEASENGKMNELIAYSAAGIGLTVVTAVVYSRGLKLFSQKLFFNATSVFLLLTAGGMLLAGVRKLIQMDALPTLKDVMWDTSAVLDERAGFGQMVSAMTGYESTPALVSVLAYALFWIVTLFFYFRVSSKSTAKTVAVQL